MHPHLSVCYLLAQGHAAPQSAGEANDLGHKRLEGEVFLEHDSPQNGLHLWNTRTCKGEQEQASDCLKLKNKIVAEF